ncbi:MAG: TetR/AcrR family transcriptional regulator [Methyloligella sp. ZOD6]
MPRIVAERSDALPALGEAFREHGYDGASLSLIAKATGLGKGSLYHFFPGGKEEMATAVLSHIDAWFAENVFRPLEETDPPEKGIETMLDATKEYFRSGQRICLVGAFALGETRDRFAEALRHYFARWISALAAALIRMGRDETTAKTLAEETVAGIQGAIVISRALHEPEAFDRAIATLRSRIAAG